MYVITKTFQHKQTQLSITVQLEYHSILEYRKVETGYKFRMQKLCEEVFSNGERLIVLEKILDKLLSAGFSVREVSTVEHSEKIAVIPTLKQKKATSRE